MTDTPCMYKLEVAQDHGDGFKTYYELYHSPVIDKKFTLEISCTAGVTGDAGPKWVVREELPEGAPYVGFAVCGVCFPSHKDAHAYIVKQIEAGYLKKENEMKPDVTKTDPPIYKAYKDGKLLAHQRDALGGLEMNSSACIDPRSCDDLRAYTRLDDSNGEPIYEGDRVTVASTFRVQRASIGTVSHLSTGVWAIVYSDKSVQGLKEMIDLESVLLFTERRGAMTSRPARETLRGGVHERAHNTGRRHGVAERRREVEFKEPHPTPETDPAVEYDGDGNPVRMDRPANPGQL